jgi:hypothetical protein
LTRHAWRYILIKNDKKVFLMISTEWSAPKDYSVKLGSLLPAERRSYYQQKNFVILKAAIAK